MAYTIVQPPGAGLHLACRNYKKKIDSCTGMVATSFYNTVLASLQKKKLETNFLPSPAPVQSQFSPVQSLF